MKILALEQELPGASPDAFKRYAEEEVRKAWLLHQAGLIRELYFRLDRNPAVLVLVCDSTDEVASILAKLPNTQEGLIAFDLIPLIAYSAFSRLFAKVDDHEMKK